MLEILWLLIWATVGDAFYDDYNWYTSDDGVSDQKAFDPQTVVRENFTNILRNYADLYISTREGDEKLTISKAKSRLRKLKVFTHTDNSNDFEPSKGQVLPLPEGAKFCTMGRHTKVDCNHCTCVAGQLYMCTGMICPKPRTKPESVETCKEGKRRKIDSCNYCYCRNKHEICSTRDCRLQHDHLLIRSQYTCHEGARRKVDCNQCICRNGEEYCSKKKCTKNKPTQMKFRQNNQKLLWAKCREGATRLLDACNTCYCHLGQEFCEKKDCDEEERLQYYRNLSYDEKQCDEGTYRQIDSCNYCLCLNGTEMCTIRPCPDNYLERVSPVCKKGSVYQIDPCNYCTCQNGAYLCTNNPCEERLTIEADFLRKSCNRWDVKYVKCNRCVCLAKRWVCTQRHCVGDVGQKSATVDEGGIMKTKLVQQPTCKEGSIKKIDSCNKCHCHKGLWFCESKDCGPDIDDLPPNCKKGDKIIVNCVPCTCRKRGWKCYIKKRKRNCRRDEQEKLSLARSPHALRMTYSHDDDEPTRKCEIGQRYRIDACNYCYCNSDRERVCTNNKCTYQQHVDDKFPLDVDEKQCKIGSRFRKGECNYCYCDYNHHLVCSKNQCTRKSSYDLSDDRELLRFTPAPKICLPHERFRLDNCNWCYCTKNRTRICERKPCPKSQKPDTRWPPNSPRRGCYIGSRFTRGKCEYCYCSVWRRIECRLRYNCTESTTTTTAKPKIYATTRRTKPRNSLNSECEVGQIQRVDDCNFCRCTYSRTWMCSDNACPSNYDNLPTIFSEPECLVGEPVPAPDPCNVCICLDSHILCTNNLCIQRQTDSLSKQPTCVEGYKYKMADGCNFCLCQGGQEFCTSRACLARDNITSNSANCNEGEVTPAEDRCNMCVCMKGKIVCTNKNCSRRKLRDDISESLLSYIRTQNNKKHKMTRGNKEKCTPGKKYFPEDFDPNCPNECICDRHELLCTKRKCYNNWDKQTPFNWPLGRVEQKKNRNANQFLKRDNCVEYQKLPSDDPCNSCICLKARKVCTIIRCTDDNEGELDSEGALFKINVQGSKGNKGNMEKEKNTFCEPFTFFSPDHNRFCRNCFCLHNGLALCLLHLCKYSKDISHQKLPEELDEICSPGETGYPTKCVTCTCSENGKWICTRVNLALCEERECDEKDEFHMGFLPYCAGCKCSVKEWFCSIQSEPCRDFSNATCPLGTFIHNPRQHCSICLCGGSEKGSHNMCFTDAKCVRQVISHMKLKK